MNCSVCETSLEVGGLALTHVTVDVTQTAVVHSSCLADVIGKSAAHKLRRLIFDSHWIRAGLPLLRGMEPPKR
jgi:hypothetical protein